MTAKRVTGVGTFRIHRTESVYLFKTKVNPVVGLHQVGRNEDVVLTCNVLNPIPSSRTRRAFVDLAALIVTSVLDLSTAQSMPFAAQTVLVCRTTTASGRAMIIHDPFVWAVAVVIVKLADSSAAGLATKKTTMIHAIGPTKTHDSKLR